MNNDLNINSNPYEELVDFDGNNYRTIKIGNQTWTADNFKCTKTKSGNIIENICDYEGWLETTDSAYCWFDNKSDNKYFGALYNWKALESDICPEGWRIPTEEDFKVLITFLAESGYNFDNTTGFDFGNKVAKSLASEVGWRDSYKSGHIGYEQVKNNNSKFDAKPNGFRFGNGKFSNTPESAILFWCLGSNNGMGQNGEGEYSVAPSLGFDDASMRFNSYHKKYGCYLRLIKE